MPDSSDFPALHDGLTKAILDIPEHVIALINDHLPTDIRERIDESIAPQELEGSFVDPRLRQSQPPISPLVIYHGEEPWPVPLSIGEKAGDSGIVDPYGLYFRYHVLDIGALPYDKMSSSPTMHASFAALRGAFRYEEGRANLRGILQVLEVGSDLATQITTYIVGRWPIPEEEFMTVLLEANPEIADEITGPMAKEFMARGEAQTKDRWFARGLARGLAQGEAKMLERLLRQQFGTLPSAVRNRIAQASVEELDAWFDRAMGASSLNAVFGDGNPH